MSEVAVARTGTSPSSEERFDAYAPFQCPGRSTRPANDVSTTLPTGATAARICFDGRDRYTPPQVLTTGVDDLVRAIDESSLYYVEPNITCSPPMGLSNYSVVFDYPSGTRTVTQEVCRGLAIGPYTREGPTGELDKTFLSMLQQQESSSAPGVAPDCPAPASDEPQGVGDLRHVVAARYCPSGSTGRGQALGAAQLARLQRWADGLMAGASSNAGRCVRPAPGWPQLSLADAWGNGFTMTLECRRRIHPVVRSVDTHHRFTRPLSLEGRTLDRLLRSLAAGS